MSHLLKLPQRWKNKNRQRNIQTKMNCFAVEAVAGGGGLLGCTEREKKKNHCISKPSLLTDSRPQYNAMQDLKCWAQRNKYSNKYSTDSPHRLPLIHTGWSHRSLTTTDTQTEKTSHTHTTLSQRGFFLFPPHVNGGCGSTWTDMHYCRKAKMLLCLSELISHGL